MPPEDTGGMIPPEFAPDSPHVPPPGVSNEDLTDGRITVDPPIAGRVVDAAEAPPEVTDPVNQDGAAPPRVNTADQWRHDFQGATAALTKALSAEAALSTEVATRRQDVEAAQAQLQEAMSEMHAIGKRAHDVADTSLGALKLLRNVINSRIAMLKEKIGDRVF